MELTTIDDQTYAYLSSLQLSDMFPSSIFYPKIQEKLFTDAHIEDMKNNNSRKQYNLIQKLTPPSVHFEKNSPITCIKVLNNVLAVCGGNIMKVYNIQTNYELINTYELSEKKPLNTLALTEIEEQGEILCALGGESPVIRVINILEGKEKVNNQLIGHRSEIFDLKFNPKITQILLSSSKDCTVRLWNTLNGDQLIIFGGPDAHLAEVLCIDWHISGDLFVSGSVDNSIKIYNITERMNELIVKSLENKKTIKTLIKNFPYYSCSDIHENYIDCVRFNGNFIISKSVDGIIKEWLPMFKTEGQYYYLINTYIYEVKEKIYNVKFCFNQEENLMFIGNETGKGYLFQINESEKQENTDCYFFKSEPKCQIDIKCNTLIRSSEYSSMYKTVFFGGECGELFLFDLVEKSK